MALIASLRNTLLGLTNRRLIANCIEPVRAKGVTPVFLIFTPEIVHFAPYCVAGTVNGFEQIILLNAVSSEDEKWLDEIHPGRLIIRLRTSLTGNRLSILPHGNILNDLFAAIDEPFCIQDPDCLVIHPNFWSEVRLDLNRHMAGGPFIKKATCHDHVLPDTFFVMFNTPVFRSICSRYKISASGTSRLVPLAQEKICTLGYAPGQYPEDFKRYFDTLQAFWILSLSEGFQFRHLPGAGENIFHIGGTSYLHKCRDYDLTHWDYWPLSVQYFNLRLLELPLGSRFRNRFQSLIERYGSAQKLLDAYPEFRNSRRYGEMSLLLDHIAGSK